jgi:hypothetical protein
MTAMETPASKATGRTGPRRNTTDTLLGIAAALLVASLFLGWFRHSQAGQLSGLGILFPSQNGNLLIVLSGWETSNDVAAAAVVLAGVMFGQLLALRLGFRGLGSLPGLVAVAGGLLAAVLIGHLIAVPPDVYSQRQPGVYIALAAAIGCFAAGLAAMREHGARLSSFDSRRLELSGLLATVGGAVVLVSMSLGWYAPRKYFGGSMPGYTPPDSLSPWAADDSYAYLLAAVAVAAILLCFARGLRLPRRPGLAWSGLALSGVIGALLVLDRIGDPHSAARNLYLFDQLSAGIYWSLAGCLAIAAGAALSLRRLSRRELADEWRQAFRALGLAGRRASTAAKPIEAEPAKPEPGSRRLPAPLVGGAVIALVTAILFVSWSPLVSAIILAAFAIGFVLKRWWLVPLPIVAAIAIAPSLVEPCDSSAADCDTAGLGAVLIVILGIAVGVTILVGVIAGRLSDRAATTSLRRRSS